MGFKWTELVYKAFGSVKDVDKEEMSILVAIAHCMNDVTNAGFPSTATLARMTHISRSTIFSRLNALEKKGYLSYVSGGFRDGRQYANEYAIKIPTVATSSVPRTTPSVPRTPPVRTTDHPRPYHGPPPVRTTDPNRNNKNNDKKNSLKNSALDVAFQLMGIGVPGEVRRPEPTITGKLMDFCRTSSPEDRRRLMSATLMKELPAIERMLERIKTSCKRVTESTL